MENRSENPEKDKSGIAKAGISGLQSEAIRELSGALQNAGRSEKHDTSAGGIDTYKDLLSRRLDWEAKKNAEEEAAERKQGKPVSPGGEAPSPAGPAPAESAQTKALEDKLAKDISGLSDAEKSKFDTDMQAFLKRAQAQGLSEAGEVDGTLKACDRLMNPGQNELFLNGLFDKSKAGQLRTMLAEQIMGEAAYPSNTDQGRFGTCPVASMETRTWFDHPAVAASIIADQALTGQWKSSDGHVVKLPDLDFTPDKYSQMTTPPDGMRSYAGQLFQATALSDVGSRQSTPEYYATGGIVKNSNGHEVGVEYWSDARGNKIEDYEGLEDVPDAQELKRIDGPNTEVLCSDPSESGSDANVVIFNSKEDLKAKLKEAQESGKMPVIITVSAMDKFFGGGDPSQGHPLDHDICIDKYDPATGNLVIDNQWGSRYDWGTTSVMGSTKDLNPLTNIDDFFPATQGDQYLDNSHRY